MTKRLLPMKPLPGITHRWPGPFGWPPGRTGRLPRILRDGSRPWAGLVLGLFLMSTYCAVGPKELDRPGDGNGPWISLFNGQDLEGWTVKIAGYELNDNPGNIFRVENGRMKVSYDQFETFDGRFGHIFYKYPFSHYRMRMEYRFVGDQTPGAPGWAIRNSGIMVHCQPPESMSRDQDFPVSIEVQLLGGNGTDERPTGNLCTPGTHVVMDGELLTRHCTNSRSRTYHGDQWVMVEVEVHGSGVIRHIVNGEVVLEYEQPQIDESDADARELINDGEVMVSGGYISLQAESHGVEFRNIELLVLDP